jgi:tripartite-type tricarboxylate transporter receptor subunit TctC
MNGKSLFFLFIITGLVSLVTAPVQSTTHEFYKGKTIRFVVGQAAGGGYDLAARTIGRHMGKHVPGNPTIAEVTYTSGEEVEKYVDEMLSITPKAKELLSFLMVKPKK